MLALDADEDQTVEVGVELQQIQHHGGTLGIGRTGGDGHVVVGIGLRADKVVVDDVAGGAVHALGLFGLLHVGEDGSVPADGGALQVAEGVVIGDGVGQGGAAPAAGVGHFLHVLGIGTELVKLVHQLDVVLGGQGLAVVLVHEVHVGGIQRQHGVVLLTVHVPHLVVVASGGQGVDAGFGGFLLSDGQHEVLVVGPALHFADAVLVGQILTDGSDLAHGLSHVGGHSDGLAGQGGLVPALLGLILGGQRHVLIDEVLVQLEEGALGSLGVHVAPGGGED